MTTTAAPAATYRKTTNGTWVIMAPAADLRPGATIVVTKRDGSTKTETIASVGKAFAVAGRMMAYGYLTAKTTSRPAGRTHGGRRSCVTDGNCSSFGSGRSCGAWDCDGY